MNLAEFQTLVKNDDKVQGEKYLRVKRKYERTLASLACPFITPLIAVQALELLIRDGKPIIYDLALNNFPDEILAPQRNIRLRKIRSMKNNAENAESKLLETNTLGELENKDDRVLPFRRKWRSTHLDELPQIKDVADGNLAFIGSRVCTKNEWMKYVIPNINNEPYSSFRDFLLSGVMPGILGAYFLLGGKKAPFEERIAGEVMYLRNASMKVDFRITTQALIMASKII